ncbi:hypothetical protein RB601_000863 [Gaeumannomyces tritici]
MENQAATSPRHCLPEPAPPVDTSAASIISPDSSMTATTYMDTEGEVTNATPEPLVLATPTPVLLPTGQWSAWDEPGGYSAECAWLPAASMPIAPVEAIGYTFDGCSEAQEYTTGLAAGCPEAGQNKGYEAGVEYLWMPQQLTETAFLEPEALQWDNLDWDALVSVSYLDKRLPLHSCHAQVTGSLSIPAAECDASLGQPWRHGHPGTLAQPHLVSTSDSVGVHSVGFPGEEMGGELGPHVLMAFLPDWS